MLEQDKADALLAMAKVLSELKDLKVIEFPAPGHSRALSGKSEDGRESFLFDINRKLSKTIRLSKCTYQNRYAVTEVLLRLDVDGRVHENPDGAVIPCPHLHVYREGYADAWAFQLPVQFTAPSDLAKTLMEFLEYCNVTNIPEIKPWLFSS
jgi:hypothetical protein